MSISITTKQHWDVFAVTTVISLLVYLRTLCPSIAGGDSGELVAEGCQLGTSHPPGYPLYTILVWITTSISRYLFPWKPPAFAVNVLSATCGSVASGLLSSCILYMISIREYQGNIHNQVVRYTKAKLMKGKKRIEKEKAMSKSVDQLSPFYSIGGRDQTSMDMNIAIFVGLLHSFSPLTWQYSVTAEVFALHNLFVGLIVHTTLRFSVSGKKNVLLLGSFLCGLALTNQHISILLVIPLVMWVLHVTELWWPFRQFVNGNPTSGTKYNNPMLLLFQAALVFLSGFTLLYSTLPLFATIYPHPGSWGNVTSFRGFFRHLTRMDYGSLRLYSGNDNGSENTFERFLLWGKDFMWSQTFPFVGIASIIACKDILIGEVCKRKIKEVGTVQSNRNQRGIILRSYETSLGIDSTIVLSLVFYLVVFHTLANLPLSNDLFFGIHQRFWMHPNFLCFILGGVGLRKLCYKFTNGSNSRTSFCQFALVAFVAFAYHKGYTKSNQSNNFYFRNYAMSILETLPNDSVLFINYDQQWTSIRYMQECEGIRKDVTSINLSMMSYDWWSSKHHHYPHINFPGSRYTQSSGGFNFSRLLDSNNAFNGKAFIGGNLSFRDESYLRRYDEIPHGMVRRIIKKRKDRDSTVESYRRESNKIWQVIAKEHSTGLPPLRQYGPETWEWTIRREFFEHFMSRSSHLLDLALTSESTSDRSKLKSIVEGGAWLDAARLNDDIANDSHALWKNLGLAYMNIVRNSETTFPTIRNLFNNTENSFIMESIDDAWWNKDPSIDWKQWSSSQWEKTWGHFLGMEKAKNDPSYEQVKAIYDQVLTSVGRR